VLVTGMVYLLEPCVQHRTHQRIRVFGSDLQPRSTARLLLLIRSVFDELDAQVSTTWESDKKHRLSHRGMLDDAHRPAAEHRLEAPNQLFPPLRSSEYVGVVTQCSQGLSSDSTPTIRLPGPRATVRPAAARPNAARVLRFDWRSAPAEDTLPKAVWRRGATIAALLALWIAMTVAWGWAAGIAFGFVGAIALLRMAAVILAGPLIQQAGRSYYERQLRGRRRAP
jgi:hypothetical protein